MRVLPHQAEFVRRLVDAERVVAAWEPSELARAVETALACRGKRANEPPLLVTVVARQIKEVIASQASG